LQQDRDVETAAVVLLAREPRVSPRLDGRRQIAREFGGSHEGDVEPTAASLLGDLLVVCAEDGVIDPTQGGRGRGGVLDQGSPSHRAQVLVGDPLAAPPRRNDSQDRKPVPGHLVFGPSGPLRAVII